MKKIRNIDPLEPPCKKTMYNTREDALDMVKYLNENRTGKEINVYQCNICGFWHLTSKTGKK
ncbi:MAG TPA: hypothetical protein VK213_14685 [Bacteroidales bacterium]|nr:hypothetical protein [Bacteroidales bacterium]